MWTIFSLLTALLLLVGAQEAPKLGCHEEWGGIKYDTIEFKDYCLRLIHIDEYNECRKNTRNSVFNCTQGICSKKFDRGRLFRAPEIEDFKSAMKLIVKEKGDVTVMTSPIAVRTSIKYSERKKYTYLHQNSGRITIGESEREEVLMEVEEEGCHYGSTFSLSTAIITEKEMCNFLRMDSANEDFKCGYEECDSADIKYFVCMHEKSTKCKVEMLDTQCLYDWETKKCYNKHYNYPPGGKHNTDCVLKPIDYSHECECVCEKTSAKWTEWSTTCGMGIRKRWRGKYVAFGYQRETTVCNATHTDPNCCIDEEIRKLPDCKTYIFNTNISLTENMCDPEGGIVTKTKTSDKCICRTGFSGILCEQEPSSCSAETCNHHGRCVMGTFGPLCKCRPSYTGKYCTIKTAVIFEEDDEPEAKDNTIIIIGSAIGGVALITIIAIVIIKTQKGSGGRRDSRQDFESSAVESTQASLVSEKESKRWKSKRSPWEYYIQRRKSSRR